MSTYNYKPGLGNAAAYQVSGKPFVESDVTVPAIGNDPASISFPEVTREFTIRNDSSQTIRVGFSSLGITGSATNYFTLGNNEQYTAPMKVTELFFVGHDDGLNPSKCTVIATLTGIGRENITDNWSGSSGVG